MNSKEKCSQCDCLTGNAGRGEDSLYLPFPGLAGEGPLCSFCYREQLIGLYQVKVELGISDSIGNFLGYGEKFTIIVMPTSVKNFKDILQCFIDDVKSELRSQIKRDIVNGRGEFGDARIIEPIKIHGIKFDKDDLEFRAVEDLELSLTDLNF